MHTQEDETELYKALAQVMKAVNKIGDKTAPQTASAFLKFPDEDVWRRVTVTIEEVKPQ